MFSFVCLGPLFSFLSICLFYFSCLSFCFIFVSCSFMLSKLSSVMPYLKAKFHYNSNCSAPKRCIFQIASINSCIYSCTLKANQHLHARHFKLGPTVFAFSVCSCGVFFFFSFFFRTHTLVNYTLVTIEHNNKTHLTSSNIKPAYLETHRSAPKRCHKHHENTTTLATAGRWPHFNDLALRQGIVLSV